MKRLLTLLLCFAMLLSLAACDKTDHTDPSEDPSAPSSPTDGPITTYTVSVHSAGGMALDNVDVKIFVKDQWDNVLMQGTTDNNGQITFDLPQNAAYVAAVDNVPDGYATKSHYAFSGTHCDIALTSSLIQGVSITGHNFQIGDVMYDFIVTTPEGETQILSEILAEKKMVMLNFWYSGSYWSMEDFPILQAVYEEYGDQFEILALDPYPTDTVADIEYTRDTLGLTFPMVQCDMEFAVDCFGSDGYPISVFIDRYGVICMIQEGSINSLRALTSVVEHFTAENYQQQLIFE